MSGGLVLHGSPHSLYTYKVALMLRLCGVGFSFRYVSFQRRMHLTPEFRALSRWGQVPVLEHETEHLGYEKGDPAGRGNGNSRNGYFQKDGDRR
jgi:hypothetical protein